MQIAQKLGLETEIFCRMVLTTKMLLSNVLGHAAELHYEKYLKSINKEFEKAPTDKHYDYVVDGKKEQIKRWETDSTNEKYLGVNLTQTHGDRSGEGAFYKKDDFINLVLFDVGFDYFKTIPINKIPTNKKFDDRLVGKFKFERNIKEKIIDFNLEFLKIMKFKNTKFPPEIENFRKKKNLTHIQLLEKCCNLTIDEIDSLFSEDNFRLIVGAKGFAAEEHFNVFLEKHNIQYVQDKNMYSKVDHWVKENLRVQVKTPHQRSTSEDNYSFKTHKSHGHGLLELYKDDEFDIVALFIGFSMDKSESKYFPKSVENKFVFIPMCDLPRYPEHPHHLVRVCRVNKSNYKINDLTLFE